MKEERLQKKSEGVSEVLSWVYRSRKIEEKKSYEKEKALQLSKIFEEQVSLFRWWFLSSILEWTVDVTCNCLQDNINQVEDEDEGVAQHTARMVPFSHLLWAMLLFKIHQNLLFWVDVKWKLGQSCY